MHIMDFGYKAHKRDITGSVCVDPVHITSKYFIKESRGVRAEMDCKEEVEKIRAQGAEQSGLLRNARAGRTNLPLSAAERAELLFLELSFVTTCPASAVQRYKSLSFE